VNAHKHHAHISVSSDPKLYDDAKPWNLSDAGTPASEIKPAQPSIRDLKIGDKGEDVKMLQTKLGVNADGDFGLNTKKAVINVQVKNNLRADGIVGPNTRKAIGI